MSIFVQIASYRDPQLEATIEDMLEEARHPNQITVGVCRQYHPADGFDRLEAYRRDRRFRILDIPHSRSAGPCWARHMVQSLFRGEEFTMQIDSHMRFVRHWHETLLCMFRTLASRGFQKPLLTGYMPAFEPDKPLNKSASEPPLQMVFESFSPQGVLLPEAEVIPDWQRLTCPVRGRFFSAGFYFTLGRFCMEVPYDPGIYFYGEEISLSVRAFTHGYDLFHPHRNVLWHYYGRKGLRKHWDDHKSWVTWNDVAIKRMRQLLRVDNEKPKGTFGRYGLGAVRTLRDYERYAGISFSRRKSLRKGP
jgi:hypothetical protein